jgi:hypothetical protein
LAGRSNGDHGADAKRRLPRGKLRLT